jgi:heterodisulfide reductase subunit C
MMKSAEIQSIQQHAKLCFQCGVCMGSCPVARVNKKFQPRRIIRELIFEKWDVVLRDESIWLCAQCHLCSENCSQGVSFSELVIDLRNLAVIQGISPPENYLKSVKQITETGRLTNVTSRVERVREQLKLGRIEPSSNEEIQRLLQDTLMEKLVSKTKEA